MIVVWLLSYLCAAFLGMFAFAAVLILILKYQEMKMDRIERKLIEDVFEKMAAVDLSTGNLY